MLASFLGVFDSSLPNKNVIPYNLVSTTMIAKTVFSNVTKYNSCSQISA
jgi:pyruvoyl-dependent arginine decarboxylase (PvlArgDC)